jgi:hypothetical protein
MSKGVISIYGAGGCGSNIVSRFEGRDQEVGRAEYRLYYFDTSTANLKDGVDPKRYYVLKDKDGSGGLRSENHPEIAKSVRNILQEQEPSDFNVVVFSGSGGSGSVAGPLIVKELLDRNLPVIAVVVGAWESNLATENTLKTLQSLDNLASNVMGKPIPVYYAQNDPQTARSETDHAIERMITCLAVLASRDNEAMDGQDILHWVQYNRVTKVKPSLAILEVYDKNEDVHRHKTPISILSLYKNPDERPHGVIPEYSKSGFPRTTPVNFNVMHFVIDHAELDEMVKATTNQVAELARLRESRVAPASLVTNKDHISDDGLVL